eukprot:6234768-Alexandrium_andersonii.AAC.1
MALSEPLVSPQGLTVQRLECLHDCSTPPRGMRSYQTASAQFHKELLERHNGAVTHSIRAIPPGLAVSSSSSSGDGGFFGAPLGEGP